MIFKLPCEKDKEPLAILTLDTGHCWQQIEGDFDKKEIEAKATAIATQYRYKALH